MSKPPDYLWHLADEQLMPLVADLDAEAFEVIYERHAQAAYGLCLRIVRSATLADDVCQEAFLSVWRSSGSYDRRLGSVRSWVLSITHNRAIDQLRRRKRHYDRQVHDEDLAERVPADESTDGEVLRRSEAEWAGRALGRLPEEQAEVIELSFYSGYSHVEIAERLGIPLGTVKGRMRLALGKLQGELAEAA